MGQLFNSALDLAFEAHLGQVRKRSGLPFIYHPLQVCARLHKWGVEVDKEEEIWCATILHDTLEDTELHEVNILRKLTISGTVNGIDDEAKRVLSLVKELTCVAETREEKEDYINSFIAKSVQSIVIKLADRLCNIEEFYGEELDRGYCPKYYNKALGLFASIKTRKQDIVFSFGESVYNKMLEDIEKVKSKVFK